MIVCSVFFMLKRLVSYRNGCIVKRTKRFRMRIEQEQRTEIMKKHKVEPWRLPPSNFFPAGLASTIVWTQKGDEPSRALVRLYHYQREIFTNNSTDCSMYRTHKRCHRRALANAKTESSQVSRTSNEIIEMQNVYIKLCDFSIYSRRIDFTFW